MKYFRNLMTALSGRNPYEKELAEARDECETTKRKVQELIDLHNQLECECSYTKGQVASCQVLIENLRQRLGEKDEVIHRLGEERSRIVDDSNRRIASYSETIAKLQEKLAVQKFLS